MHSSAVTEICLRSPDPEAMERKIWAKCRYLVAQKPVTERSSVTNDMYYLGRITIPGPRADQSLTGSLAIDDLEILKAKHSIQFIDFQTTAGAASDVTEAHFTVMSDPEADDYERQLRAALVKERTNAA